MPTLTLYALRDHVTERLGPGYNDNGALTPSRIDDLIRDSGEWIDGGLGDKFIQFNGVGDTPPTPRPIQSLAREKTRLECWKILQVGGRNSQLQDQIESLEEWCEKQIKLILKGDVIIKEEEVVDETLVWGDNSNYGALGWPTNWARLGATGTTTQPEVPNIIPSSLRVTSPSTLTGYKNGQHFQARYDDRVRKWFLIDNDGQLRLQTSKVSYKWNYQRTTDNVQPGRRLTGRWELA